VDWIHYDYCDGVESQFVVQKSKTPGIVIDGKVIQKITQAQKEEETVGKKELVRSEVKTETKGQVTLTWGGTLTLGKMREFMLEAESAGVDEDDEVTYDTQYSHTEDYVGRVHKHVFYATVSAVPAYQTSKKRRSKPMYERLIKPAIYTGIGVAGFGLFTVIVNLLHVLYAWLPWT
jgi:hypothetical protein